MLLDEYKQLIEVPQYKRPYIYIYILLLPRSIDQKGTLSS